MRNVRRRGKLPRLFWIPSAGPMASSAEDVAAYDKMEADVVNLGKEIDRLERQAALDAELSKPVSAPITGKPAAPTERKRRSALLRNTGNPSGTPCGAKCPATRF